MIKSENIQNDDEFQKILRKLGLENKPLTKEDLCQVYGYMQNAYFFDSNTEL